MMIDRYGIILITLWQAKMGFTALVMFVSNPENPQDCHRRKHDQGGFCFNRKEKRNE